MKIDRISRLPLVEAQKLVDSIRSKEARLAVPGLVDLSEFATRLRLGFVRSFGADTSRSRQAMEPGRAYRPFARPSSSCASCSLACMACAFFIIAIYVHAAPPLDIVVAGGIGVRIADLVIRWRARRRPITSSIFLRASR